MPAISPEQLNRKIDELLALEHDPPAFIRACMNLLTYYADRTKRPRGSAARIEIARIMRVPRPVMKTLCARIQQSEQGQPFQWLQIGRGLWDKAIREARYVAACTLAQVAPDRIAAEVTEWALVCEDEEALRYVAFFGMRSWRTARLDLFYASLEAWLADPRLRLRHLAILALQGRAEDDGFDELPQVLTLMAGLSGQVRGGSQRSLTALVRHLGTISAPEVTKYLIVELERRVTGASRLVRAVLATFPEKHQLELTKRLG